MNDENLKHIQNTELEEMSETKQTFRKQIGFFQRQNLNPNKQLPRAAQCLSKSHYTSVDLRAAFRPQASIPIRAAILVAYRQQTEF